MRITVVAIVSVVVLFSGTMATLVHSQKQVVQLEDRLSASEDQVASLGEQFTVLRQSMRVDVDQTTQKLINASQIPLDRDSPIDRAILDRLRQQEGWVRDSAGTAGASADAAARR